MRNEAHINVGETSCTSPHLFKRRRERFFRDLNYEDSPVARAETIRDSRSSSLQLFYQTNPCARREFKVSSLRFKVVRKITKRTHSDLRSLRLVAGNLSEFGPIRLNPTFEMFLRNEAKLCRPSRAIYIGGPVPRASLRRALGYLIIVPSGLAEGQIQKITKRSHALGAPVQRSEFQVQR